MDNLRGIGLMVAAMASFAVSDLFVKYASATVSPAEILLFMGLLGAAVFAGLTRFKGLPVLSAIFLNRNVLIRNGFEAFGSVCMITALALAPLSLVAAITQAMPLVVTVGATLFLGEKVGARRWIAIAVGLFGVLLILRPGSVELSWGALAALGATLGLGARDVATRLIPRGISNLQLATYAFTVLIPVSATLVAFQPSIHLPDIGETGLLLGASLSAVLAYYAIIAAMRVGEVSAVGPFRYTRILFALTLATLFLGERPSAMTLLGASIVIGSGLFVLLRERTLARRGLSRTSITR